MIVVTGAAGFIGSVLVSKLMESMENVEIVGVDDFSRVDKVNNFVQKGLAQKIHRDELMSWLKMNHAKVSFMFHLGARTDTTEFDYGVFEKLNVVYSQAVWQACAEYNIPMVYASSAATYGMGEFGYIDEESIVERLCPLNPYGVSKNEFDKWMLKSMKQPPFWAGLKFFNVYGANEYHKGRMASVVFHTYEQILKSGEMRLFKSHNERFSDGEQARDFIYVEDVVKICLFLMKVQSKSAIYNVGTGVARTFNDLAKNVFYALDLVPKISYIDTPVDIRGTYQYFTQAEMSKLRGIGYDERFYSLEEGVADYVRRFLVSKSYR
jgi:ADP-L-glycero-D-manno-heptose 6-epimerase